MSSTRNIKQRIANVSSVEQIIKAMDMVSSTKLHKARAQLNGVRPIYYELKRITEELSATSARSHVFYKGHKVRSSLYIIFTSDRGLCGSYNTNIMSKALENMNQGKNEKLIIVGSKGNEYFRNKDKNIIHSFTDVDESQMYYASERVAKRLIEIYLNGEVDEVFVAYTHFETALSYVPTVERLLPLTISPANNLYCNDEKYEPDINTFIDNVIPLYLHMKLFRAYSESHTSEQAARMVNMDAAGKNASDLIEELNHMYNRKRQADITQELSEIVGSVNVLNKGGIDES